VDVGETAQLIGLVIMLLSVAYGVDYVFAERYERYRQSNIADALETSQFEKVSTRKEEYIDRPAAKNEIKEYLDMPYSATFLVMIGSHKTGETIPLAYKRPVVYGLKINP
jgi:hypothetical protein